MENLYVFLGIGVVVLLVIIIFFKMVWRVAEPNEALIISGLGAKRDLGVEGLSFKIVTGGGTSVMPSRWCAGCRSTCARPTWPSSA
jgi:uncharacterized membrane protein YqiK